MVQGDVKAVALLTGLGWPFFVMIGFLAPSLIHVLCGEQWGSAAALTPVLCVAAMVELSYALLGEGMIAQGRVERSSHLQIAMQGMWVPGLLLVWPFGLVSATWGLVAASVSGAAAAQWCLIRTAS